MPLVGVKAPDAVEGTEASVPTLGVKGFWPWAFVGCRNTSLAPAAVLFPVRAKPSPAPAPITARITRPIRTRLPVRTPPCVCPPSPPPVAAGERVGGTVSSGDATNPGEVGSPEEADGPGESGSVGGGDSEGPAAAEECPSTRAFSAWNSSSLRTPRSRRATSLSSSSAVLISRPRLPGLANDTGVAGKVCRRDCHVNGG